MSHFPDLGGCGRTLEFARPNIGNFDALRESFLELAEAPAAQVVPVKDRLTVRIEHTLLDENAAIYVHPLTIKLTGILDRISGDLTTLRAYYTETSGHPDVRGAQLVHCYRMERGINTIIAARHSINASPVLNEEVEPIEDRNMNLVQWLQADAGDGILKRELGDNLPLTIGDCGILYDRILELQQF